MERTKSSDTVDGVAGEPKGRQKICILCMYIERQIRLTKKENQEQSVEGTIRSHHKCYQKTILVVVVVVAAVSSSVNEGVSTVLTH